MEKINTEGFEKYDGSWEKPSGAPIEQSSEEVRAIINKIINEPSSLDEADPAMAEWSRKELALILEQMPELEELGYKINVHSTGMYHNLGVTKIYVTKDSKTVILCSHIYDSFVKGYQEKRKIWKEPYSEGFQPEKENLEKYCEEKSFGQVIFEQRFEGLKEKIELLKALAS